MAGRLPGGISETVAAVEDGAACVIQMEEAAVVIELRVLQALRMEPLLAAVLQPVLDETASIRERGALARAHWGRALTLARGT